MKRVTVMIMETTVMRAVTITATTVMSMAKKRKARQANPHASGHRRTSSRCPLLIHVPSEARRN